MGSVMLQNCVNANTMDLVATLRSKIDKLPEGEHSAGLEAVSSHIETAFGHLSRGQRDGDDTAFTDVIYRTNQAFEGSIKEAYRVLAGNDPSRQRPFDIENYLESNGVFRERVLAQFTNYRTEWRNPSTHDYKLDFDESEAFLAIVSVSAFACVLIDQVASKLAYNAAVEETATKKDELKQNFRSDDVSLMDLAIELFKEFHCQHGPDSGIQTEIQLMGALTGFISSLVPSVESTLDYPLRGDTHERADLMLSTNDDKVVVELKRTYSPRAASDGLLTLQRYMAMAGLTNGILFLYSPTGGEVVAEEQKLPDGTGRIVIVRPKNTA